MTTLLLRFAGPMQSWGTQSRFTVRDAGAEPSKSGVVGLLCAALGRRRNQTVDDLAALKLGVRVDKEGVVRLDYHTAGGTHLKGESYGVRLASGDNVGTVVSRRYYLADADFLVGLEGEENLLRQLEKAVAEPVWQTYLGRKAFVPGVPVRIPEGFKAGFELETALVEYPWPRAGLRVPPPRHRPSRLLFVLETDGKEGEETRRDQPLGTAYQERRFVPRYVRRVFHNLGKEIPIRGE